MLTEHRGDLWDSGKVAGEASVHVEYAGRPLAARLPCFWKVRVWDQDAQEGPWSAAASWSMGLLQPADWQAKWIRAEQKTTALFDDCRWYWHGPPGPGEVYPPGTRYFRRKLVLPEGARLPRRPLHFRSRQRRHAARKRQADRPFAGLADRCHC